MIRSRLVGRATEVALLESAVSEVGNGRGGIVHVVGEPGAGKTSLLDVARSAADAAAVPTMATTVDETDQRRRLACALRLIPTLEVSRHSDPVGAALAAIEELDGPRVMLVDDLQWADGPSADVLAAIGRRSEDLGLLLVTAARSHPRALEVSRFEATVDRCGLRLELAALGSDDVSELVELTLGAAPDASLAQLLAGASGNPFLTVELLRALERDQALVLADGNWRVSPDAVLPSLLGERLAREAIGASGHDSLLIRAAAVVPGGFMPEELAGIVARPLVEVLADLLTLTDANVLNERDGRLAFRHDIIRQAVVDATPAPVVRALNRRAVSVLTDAGADRARIASCLLVAADPRDPNDVTALIELGRSLRDEGAYAAADVLRAALDRLDPHDPRYVDVALDLGWVLLDLGHLTDVLELLTPLAPTEAQQLDVRRLQGHVYNLRGELVREFTPLPDDFDIDAAFVRVDERAATVVAELAMLEMGSGRVDRAERLVDWVRRSGVALDPEGEVYLCTTTAWLHARDGSYEAGLEVALRGVAVTSRHPCPQTSRMRPTVITAVLLEALGRGDEAVRMLRAGHDQPGPTWQVPLLQFCTAVSLYRRGEWDDALAEVTAGLASAEEFGVRLGTAWPHALNIMISTARGEQAAANAWLDRARVEVPPGSLGLEWLAHATAMVCEASGDAQGALDMLRFSIDVALERNAPAVVMNLSTDTARLARTFGDEALLDKVVDNLGRLAAKTRSPVVHGFHEWTIGWQRQDHTAVERAASAAAACGRHAEHVRAHHDAAVIAASAGCADEARRLASVAFAAYERMRAQQLHARLRAELRAYGLSMRPRRSPPRPTVGWDALTDTERRIVELVGDGLANGTIADQLFVSRRTVESHLARVYQKLGYPRRAELVVAAREHRHSPILA